MQADISKAASKDDVYELINLARVHTGTRVILQVGEAVQDVARRLGQKGKKRDLAYLLLLPADPELAGAAECVVKELVALGPEAVDAVLYAVQPASPETAKLLAITVLEAVGNEDGVARLRDSLQAVEPEETPAGSVPRPETVAQWASDARAAGKRFFQVAVPVSVTARGGLAGYLTTSLSRVDVSPAAPDILEAVEAEGWRLEHVGYVFEEQGSISAARVFSIMAGQKEAVMGSIVGIYLFRAT